MSNISQYSTTASSNNSSPPDGWPEGMAPSAVNDAAREMQAALAKWYQDTQGTLVTGGTGNAYTLTTNNAHAALADQSMIVFRADRANTGSATLNVDSLGAKNIRANGDSLRSDYIKANKSYVVVYNSNDDSYDLVTLAVDDIVQSMTTAGDILAGDGAGVPSVINMGTKGDLLVGDGAGTPAIVGVGSDDETIVADSAQSSGIKWDRRGYIPLKSESLSSATNGFEVSFDASKYSEILIVASGVFPSNTTDDLYVLTSTDSGSNFDTSTGDYRSKVIEDGSAQTGLTASGVLIVNNVPTSGAGLSGYSGVIRIVNPDDIDKTVISNGGYLDDSDVPHVISGWGIRDGGAAVNAVRVAFDSGSVESGEFFAYGLREPA